MRPNPSPRASQRRPLGWSAGRLRALLRLASGLLLFPFALGTARAADLVEPWPVGLSDFELGVAVPASGQRSECSVLGMGLAENLSLGYVFEREAGAAGGGHLLLLYSRPLGHRAVLDVWYAVRTDHPDLVAGARGGFEWSFAGSRLVPYVRVTAERGPAGTAIEPLLGAMLPVSPHLQLHVELSAPAGDAGERPLRLAVGPNWALTPRLELLPEFSWSSAPGGSRALEMGLNVIVNLAH